ncbi:hypothetical protein FB451DRAFT_1073952 [Mycena latifolia]|nr:hypothetical protein FB451DRAFT_1073952 [Mycena latifolia]
MANLTACQRTLQIAEIVRMICDQADTGLFLYASSPKKTLVALARTSKIFSDPAFDIIWRYQTSLAPLVKCMPDTLWEERVGTSKKSIRLRRPIVSADIPRLLFYSVRVKALNLQSYSERGTVHTDFLKALDLCLVPHVLMPKLSYFSWCPATEGALSFFHHFLGPQSRTILLDFTAAKSALSLLPYMKSLCPLVTEFNLVATVNQITIPAMSDVVCSWQQLQQLTVGNLDEAGFIHIAKLPRLKQLRLGPVENKGHPPLYLPELLLGPSFPALEILGLSCDTARFCVGIIRVISSRQLKNINITPVTDWTAVAWEEIHTTLHECLDHEKLVGIEVQELNQLRPRPVDVTPYILTSSTLRPLLAFNFHHIRFQLDPGVEVDDNFLEEMAVAWPNLGLLLLGTEIFTARRPHATLKCLIPFARHCPNLNGLGIRMDVLNVPEFSQVAGDRITHFLDALYVGTSPMNADQTTEVAAFLSNLFVDLQYVFVCDKDPMPEPFKTYEQNWDRMAAMIPVFCSVRQQEKKFWTAEFDGEDSSEEDGEAELSITLDDAETLQ